MSIDESPGDWLGDDDDYDDAMDLLEDDEQSNADTI